MMTFWAFLWERAPRPYTVCNVLIDMLSQFISQLIVPKEQRMQHAAESLCLCCQTRPSRSYLGRFRCVGAAHCIIQLLGYQLYLRMLVLVFPKDGASTTTYWLDDGTDQR
eukprot:gnl/MRDRNA2_/MRDRNA2_58540_c0_seq1.p1 gnl/MRDRNA2_/MRDRNA2_58540_c0~~gnl/MRDRNA2_/MRDRNA2_58540_c0_seq1.p1  ORF type:complete len:110 (+),score=3.19 gnl/MRDRNA2_/MRDRNA2_58540_c0_seq1:201-530(+)